jgi:isoquinoline 1-oxidoreductase beta subunit
MPQTNNNDPSLSRRQFLIGSVSASLLMAFAPVAAIGADAQQALAAKKFSPTVWFEINPKGEVLINIARAEMGQHIGTSLARIVADELGADWEKVSIKHVDSDPKWGYMVTGGSWSVFQSFKPMSQAGAAGRLALIDAGAALLGKPAAKCEAVNGQVVCGNHFVSFGDIVKKGHFNRIFSAEEIAALPIKPASQRRFIGKQTMALDIVAKTDGSAKYGIDTKIEGMVYARPLIPPTRYGSSVKKVDDKAARQIAGYLGYEILNDPSATLQGWVTVIATSYNVAIKAADALTVSYQAGPTAGVSEGQIQQQGEKLVRDKNAGYLIIDDGDTSKADAAATTRLEARYRTASVIHFQLEPVNATVEYKDGIWHIHSGNQWQSLTLPLVAKALGVTDDKVIMHQYYLGGGFGRRLYGDYIIPAALTAKAIGKPVKLVFTRPDDSRFSQPRSPSVQLFNASLDSNQQISGIEHALTAGWPSKTMAPAFMPQSLDKKGHFDPFSTNGADHWYSLESHRVRVINNDLAQRTFQPGWLRSVGPGWIGWGVESFMDEVAHAAGKDPLEFRLGLLDGKGKQAGKSDHDSGGAKRLANVLKRLKTQVQWGKTLAKNEGLGVAVCTGQERNMPTWIACAAHVHVNPDSGKVTVKKLSLTVDCGTVVHPDGALAQLEGSVLWGVSLALHESNSFKDGQVTATNLDTYTPLRMVDVPELEIQFVPSDVPPVGLGEPGVIVVAPAIGNAIFKATGVRVRDLPIRPEAIV